MFTATVTALRLTNTGEYHCTIYFKIAVVNIVLCIAVPYCCFIILYLSQVYRLHPNYYTVWILTHISFFWQTNKKVTATSSSTKTMTHIKYHSLDLCVTPYFSQNLTQRHLIYISFRLFWQKHLSQIHQARCHLLIYARIFTDFILG